MSLTKILPTSDSATRFWFESGTCSLPSQPFILFVFSFQLDEYIESPLVNSSNRFIALAFKSNFENKNNVLKIQANEVQIGAALGTFFSLSHGQGASL